MEQVKTVVADSYDFAEQQSYLLFLQRPRAGDTFATQGDYYTLVGGAEGVYPIGYLPISLRSDYSLPMYNSQDQGTMMEDAMLAAIQQTNQQTPVAQGEAPNGTPRCLGRSLYSAGAGAAAPLGRDKRQHGFFLLCSYHHLRAGAGLQPHRGVHL